MDPEAAEREVENPLQVGQGVAAAQRASVGAIQASVGAIQASVGAIQIGGRLRIQRVAPVVEQDAVTRISRLERESRRCQAPPRGSPATGPPPPPARSRRSDPGCDARSQRESGRARPASPPTAPTPPGWRAGAEIRTGLACPRGGHATTSLTRESSVRPKNSLTRPRTRTRSPASSPAPRPPSKTKSPSELAGSASVAASSCCTKKPPRPPGNPGNRPTTTASTTTPS